MEVKLYLVIGSKVFHDEWPVWDGDDQIERTCGMEIREAVPTLS